MAKEPPLLERIKETVQYSVLTLRFKFEPHGWAIFRIDEEWGSLAVESDWGNYNYAWGHGGRSGRTLQAFLAHCSSSYMAEKLCGMRASLFDGDRTRTEMSKRAAELYKEGRLTISEHADLIHEIGRFVYACEEEPTSTEWYRHAEGYVKEHFDPIWEHVALMVAPRHQLLMDEIIPVLQDHLLKMEAAGAPASQPA